MKANDCDGQMDLFGITPFVPKEEGAEPVEEVELDTEFEDFLSVGKKQKKEIPAEEPEKERPVQKPEKKMTQKKQTELNPDFIPQKAAGSTNEKIIELSEIDKADEETVHIPVALPAPGELHAVMQKSFYSASGKTATVAYIDYNMVYTQDLKGKARLVQYPDSRQAVDEYLRQMAQLSGLDDTMEVKEHPKFKKVNVLMPEEK